MTGYEALRSHAAWIDLSTRGKIRVTGDDRVRLLHGMSTNDVKNLAPGDGLYSFFLTAQGRIIADAYIYSVGDSLLLDTEPETVSKLRDHLDKYIIAEDVTLEDETDQWATLGIEGPQSVNRAVELGIPVPDKAYSVQHWNSGFTARVATSSPEGLRVFVPASQKADLVRRLDDAAISQASFDAARVVRLENGIPRYGEDITERYLVQETGAMHGVHLNKGCYIGQEIVERVRSRAQIHRHLKPIRIMGQASPEPGTKLMADGKEVGEITSAAYSPALGEVVALAYLRTLAVESRPPMYVSGSSATATVAYSPSNLP
jgi:tRNA-modifying protein YgfZ